MIEVDVEVARGRASRTVQKVVVVGTLVKQVVRDVGESPEGSAVLRDGVSIPLDTPLTVPVRLVIVPTFSGG
ncbi:MAG TPA: hypothetical protein VMH49_06660 [Thermoplasmata archaeon]|nr:hypothetical protein [Thermoplasmata archaeon]